MKINYKPAQENTVSKIVPWLGSLALFPFMIYFVFNIGHYGLIDYVDLLIHEGGHGIFRFFGKFIYTLGGSLMQLIIPSMFIGYYFFKRISFGMQIFLTWLGQNLLNISVYIADAQAQQLPLLGGKKVYHDWHYILGELGFLDYDKMFGEVFIFLAISFFVVALITPLIINKCKTVEINLNL
jgi:hypothetical protein